MLAMSPQDGFEKYICDKAFDTETPISGTFELLPICNMDCTMCYVRLSREEMERQGSPLSLQHWIEIGKQAAKQGTLFLLLTGGEPFLYPDFDILYKGLRKLGIAITINTNGTLITDKIVELFLKDKPRRVNISLYGTSNQVYQQLCRNPHGYDQVMDGIRRLLDAKVPVKLNYTLTPQNQVEVDRILKLSDEIGVPISVPTYMFPPIRKKGIADTSMFQRLEPEQAAKKQLEVLYKNFHEDEDYTQQIEQLLQGMKGDSNKEEVQAPGGCLCSAGRSSFWINWKGDLTSCGMLDHPSVNLCNTTFSSAWNQIKEETKQITTSNKCFNCRFRSVCQVCAASSYAETGSYSNEVEYHCKFCKAYEKLLKKHLIDLENHQIAW